MSSKNKKQYQWFKIPGEIEIIVSKKVKNQIKYLCDKISSVEWSGILFYTIDGDITTPEAVIKLEYIYPKDKGSSAFTEYEYDDDFIEWRMKHPENVKWLIGHIHSHNNMNTYFSGTDNEELEDNAENHNFYLSVIVNNRMESVAKMVFQGETEESKVVYTLNSSNGDKWKVKVNKQPFNAIFYKDCNISLGNNDVSSEFIELVENIIKREELSRRAFTDNVNNSWKDHLNNKELIEGRRLGQSNIDPYSFNTTPYGRTLHTPDTDFNKYLKPQKNDVFKDLENDIFDYPPFIRDQMDEWNVFFLTKGVSIDVKNTIENLLTDLDNEISDTGDAVLETMVKELSNYLRMFNVKYSKSLTVEMAIKSLLYDLELYEDSTTSADLLINEINLTYELI
jgi:proteasome lid subunit RPN8/RPN11